MNDGQYQMSSNGVIAGANAASIAAIAPASPRPDPAQQKRAEGADRELHIDRRVRVRRGDDRFSRLADAHGPRAVGESERVVDADDRVEGGRVGP